MLSFILQGYSLISPWLLMLPWLWVNFWILMHLEEANWSVTYDLVTIISCIDLIWIFYCLLLNPHPLSWLVVMTGFMVFIHQLLLPVRGVMFLVENHMVVGLECICIWMKHSLTGQGSPCLWWGFLLSILKLGLIFLSIGLPPIVALSSSSNLVCPKSWL